MIAMSNVNQIGAAASTRFEPARADRAPAPQQPATTQPGVDPARLDQLELSSEARALDRLRQDAGVRDDLVARVRAEIASGSYVTPEKIDRAVDGIRDDLAN